MAYLKSPSPANPIAEEEELVMTSPDTNRNISLEEMDKQSLLHPYTSITDHLDRGPVIITKGHAARVTDSRGRDYIDSMGGLWCVNIGHGRQEMVDAITAQAQEIAYYHLFFSMANEPAIRLADKVLQLMPDHMSKVFFCNSGSEANDTQVKIAWYYNNLRGKPEKKKIIARKLGYHGVTAVAASMTGLPQLHKSFNLPLDGFLHVSAPHHYWNAANGETEREFSKRLAKELDSLIEHEDPTTIAAFIAEPVMGAGGVVPPPDGYFSEIQKVLKKHDILFIADEVICGFGRLGTMFGTNLYQLEPDMMTLAKGLTSAYVPMSAAVISEKVWDVLKSGSPETGPFAHGYTYGGHPLAAAAGLKTIEIMERENLVDHAHKVGAYLQRRLRETFSENPLVGEVRGVGLMAGVELVADKDKKIPFEPSVQIGPRVTQLLMEEGVIHRAINNTIAFSPPLVITETDIDEMLDRCQRGVKKMADQLVGEGMWKAA